MDRFSLVFVDNYRNLSEEGNIPSSANRGVVSVTEEEPEQRNVINKCFWFMTLLNTETKG